MGMFTTIIHPKDGRKLQIKCGNDELEVFKLGDSVGQVPLATPGVVYLPDDVYDSYSSNGHDSWVVILNGKVHAIIDREDAEKEAISNSKDHKDAVKDGDDREYPDFYFFLYGKFKIKPVPSTLWTEDQWEKHTKEQEEFRESYENRRKERFQSLSSEAQQIAETNPIVMELLTRPLLSDFGREIFKTEPIPQVSIDEKE